ncbi:CC137 protein, partial [Amia calva]|nr:CC137 protein [Amia calva]
MLPKLIFELFCSKAPKKDAKPNLGEDLDHIPYRLREIMKSKERMKRQVGKSKKKDSKRLQAEAFQLQTDIPVPKFHRGKRESEKAYFRRMNQETQHVLFLTNNQLENQPEKEAPQEKAKSEKKKDFDKTRLNRLLKKKVERKEQRKEKEMFTDTVKFGEVAMAPPSLTAKPRKAPIKAKGGCKNLLLSPLLGSALVSAVKPSMARQRIMEEERQRVVLAYRRLKAAKQEKRDSAAARPDRRNKKLQ